MSAVYARLRLASTSPRAESWRRIFGSDTVPLESSNPVVGTLPGPPGDVVVYKVAVSRLTPEQRARLESAMATRLGLSRAEAATELDGPHGLPILAEDIELLDASGASVPSVAQPWIGLI